MRVILASGSPRRRELLKKIIEDFEVITAKVNETAIEERLIAAGGYYSEAELAVRMVRELSKAKAMAVFDLLGQPVDAVVIGSDTVVCLENEILGKPENRDDAVRMLRAQSMEPQKVITGVALIYRGVEKAESGHCCNICEAAECCPTEAGDLFGFIEKASKPENDQDSRTLQPEGKLNSREELQPEDDRESIEVSTKVRIFSEETLVFFKPLDDAQEQRIQEYCDTEEPYDKAGAYGIQLNGNTLVDRFEGDYDNIVGFPVKKVRAELAAFIEMPGSGN